jgi:hypothetical protein
MTVLVVCVYDRDGTLSDPKITVYSVYAVIQLAAQNVANAGSIDAATTSKRTSSSSSGSNSSNSISSSSSMHSTIGIKHYNQSVYIPL